MQRALRLSRREIYQTLDYSVADLEAAAGGHIAISDDKATVIMARMRNPSLSIHGIEGAFSGGGAKTVIPATVGGKFSLRLVSPVSPRAVWPSLRPFHPGLSPRSSRPIFAPRLRHTWRLSSLNSTPSAI